MYSREHFWHQKSLDKCLKSLEVRLELLPILQALGADTAKGQVLGRAQLIVLAVGAGKVLAATRAALHENNFGPKDTGNGVEDLLDVVVTLNRKHAQVTVVIDAQMHETDELLFFQPRELESLLIQNNNHKLRTCSS